MTWGEPDSDGGSNVTGYGVPFRRGTSGGRLDRRCSVSDPPTPIEETCSDHQGDVVRVAGIMAVTNGAYYVRVAAMNAGGIGPWATATRRVR